jgi:hypothetical protein
MHDAVTLANLIYTLPMSTLSIKDLNNIFSIYWTERHPAALEELQSGHLLNRTRERGLSGTLARFVARTTPNRLWRQVFGVSRRTQIRPLVAYLPGVEEMAGITEPVTQTSFLKAREEFERREGSEKGR